MFVFNLCLTEYQGIQSYDTLRTNIWIIWQQEMEVLFVLWWVVVVKISYQFLIIKKIHIMKQQMDPVMLLLFQMGVWSSSS